MQGVLDNSARRTSRGYTGHEHLDRTGFIHMNGRVYDPELGRFLSPDPLVQAPGNSQSWNRYSYVFNSPLSYTDPSGYIPEVHVTGSGPSRGGRGSVYEGGDTIGTWELGGDIGWGEPDFENQLDNALKNCWSTPKSRGCGDKQVR